MKKFNHNIKAKEGKGEHLKTGKLGEEMARQYLKKKGHKIIEQNYKTKYGEIDLVSQEGKELVFVEVRTRQGEDYGLPEETLKPKKLKKVLLNAQAYINTKKWQGKARIDAICIVLGEKKTVQRLNHYKNII